MFLHEERISEAFLNLVGCLHRVTVALRVVHALISRCIRGLFLVDYSVRLIVISVHSCTFLSPVSLRESAICDAVFRGNLRQVLTRESVPVSPVGAS